MSTEPRVPRHVTRRAVLGGAGAAGIALPAFIAAGGASAVTGGGPPADPPATTPRSVRGNAFSAAAVTPGLSYQTFTGNSFRVRSGAVMYDSVWVAPASTAQLYLPFEHPNGVTIRELEVYVQDVPPGGTADLRLLEASTNFETVLLPALALPGGGTPQTVARVDYNVDVDAAKNQASVNVTLSAPGKLLGARLGFQDFVGLTYFPVDPSKREIDTRGIRGRLVAFETYRVALEVPPFAFALVNLTLTQTIAAGFLSAFPADIAWPGTSSVNWFQTNQDTANLTVVGTDSQGAMNLYCGAGQTHVVIDLQGFYY
ncbi:MAG: hypothetical protein ABJD24_13885 [Acidimicrobiales bacterium]